MTLMSPAFPPAPAPESTTGRASARRTLLAATIVLIIALLSAPAAAEPLAHAVGPLSSGEHGLLRIDLATGEVAEIGAFGPGIGTVAVAFSPDGRLYGIGHSGDGDAQLVTIDRTTGAATLIADLTLSDPFNALDSLAVDACGRFFAGGEMGVFGGGLRDKVIALDPSSGTVQEVASAPLDTGPKGLAARGEILFTVRQGVLSMLDPTTGEITPVGGTSVPPLDLDFAEDGFLWTAHGANPIPIPIPAPPPPGATFRIHPATGQVTQMAETLHEMFGSIAIGPPPGVCGAAGPPAIPAVSPGGLGLLAILLAAAAAGVLSVQKATRADRELSLRKRVASRGVSDAPQRA
jgi:streptogramin lyase